MDAREFQEKPLLERVEYINALLLKFDEEPLKKAAEAVNMSYSAFCKEMRRGEFTYSQSKRQYEKTLSLDEFKKIQSSISSEDVNEEVVRFFASHLDEFKELLNVHKNEFILDPKVYDPNSKSVSKSLFVNKEIYNEFTDLCTKQYGHLKLRDIVSQCLYDFVKRHQKTPS
jgi:hypothetical protein